MKTAQLYKINELLCKAKDIIDKELDKRFKKKYGKVRK